MKHQARSMSRLLLCLLCVPFVMNPKAVAETSTPTLQEIEDRDLPTDWFEDADGYEEALALQKETGADIFVYIRNAPTSNMRGLCKWFEKHGLKKGDVSKLVRHHFIKVRLDYPSNNDSEELIEDFYAPKGPSVVIVKPDGWRNRVKVFDWPGGEPDLKSHDELLDLFRKESSLPDDFDP